MVTCSGHATEPSAAAQDEPAQPRRFDFKAFAAASLARTRRASIAENLQASRADETDQATYMKIDILVRKRKAPGFDSVMDDAGDLQSGLFRAREQCGVRV